MAQKGKGLAGALSRMPREKAKERLSPGVYRGERGGLVGQNGRALRPPEMATPEQYNRLPGRGINPSQIGQPDSTNANEIGRSIANKGPMQTNMDPGQLGDAIANGTMQEGQMDQGMREFLARYRVDPGQMQPGNYMVPNWPQMPQPSANNNGQYRLSPGVYGTREQAMQQYNESRPQFSPGGSMPEGMPGRPYTPYAINQAYGQAQNTANTQPINMTMPTLVKR